ncbi:hypothetical protein JCM16163A_29220 [Paenibacillus sp. YK5]|nr:hypothetical protein PN4B1_16490 [Paenibacillus naphthalenovorans]
MIECNGGRKDETASAQTSLITTRGRYFYFYGRFPHAQTYFPAQYLKPKTTRPEIPIRFTGPELWLGDDDMNAFIHKLLNQMGRGLPIGDQGIDLFN